MVGLSKYINALGIPIIAGITLLMTWLYNVIATEDMIRQSTEHNRVLTRTLSNALWSQVDGLNNTLMEEQRKFGVAGQRGDHFALDMISALLDEPIAELLNGTDVLRLKIFNANGMVIYSTNEEQIGDVDAEEWRYLQQALSGKTKSSVEFHDRFVSRSNTMQQNRYVLSSYTPVYNHIKGKTDGVVELYNDVTSTYENLRKSQLTFAGLLLTALISVYTLVLIMVRRLDRTLSHNIELKVARDSATQSSSAKSQFLANMSHELRTPLNAIIGYSEIIEEEVPLEQEILLGDVGKIQSAAKHLLHLINEILDLSKIEAGEMKTYVETLNVEEMVGNVVALIKPTILANNNEFNVMIELENDSIHSDALKLRQIFLNLLSNAAKFCQNGKIDFIIRSTTECLTIEVKDTGIGMSESQIDNLFQPFVQADASTTRQYGGTGLGLTITKQFCEMLHGKMFVESSLDVGTRFFLEFPIDANAIHHNCHHAVVADPCDQKIA